MTFCWLDLTEGKGMPSFDIVILLLSCNKYVSIVQSISESTICIIIYSCSEFIVNLFLFNLRFDIINSSNS